MNWALEKSETIKHTNTHIMGVPEEGERRGEEERGAEKTVKRITEAASKPQATNYMIPSI